LRFGIQAGKKLFWMDDANRRYAVKAAMESQKGGKNYAPPGLKRPTRLATMTKNAECLGRDQKISFALPAFLR
jgi:hypothetical protein